MSTMHVAFCAVMGGGAPVYAAKPRAAQAVTTSGTAAATTITAQGGEYARVAAVDAALYVTTGATASAATGYYVPIGGVLDLGPMLEGATVSGIEA